jgi:tRNA pseudouridine-54 N-methylase
LWSRIVSFLLTSKDKGTEAVRIVGNHIEVSIKKVAESKAGQQTLRGIKKIREQQEDKRRSITLRPGFTSNKEYYNELVKKYTQNPSYYKPAKYSGLDQKTVEAIRKIQRREIEKFFK